MSTYLDSVCNDFSIDDFIGVYLRLHRVEMLLVVHVKSSIGLLSVMPCQSLPLSWNALPLEGI